MEVSPLCHPGTIELSWCHSGVSSMERLKLMIEWEHWICSYVANGVFGIWDDLPKPP